MRGEVAEVIKGNNSVNSFLSSASEECWEYMATARLGNGIKVMVQSCRCCPGWTQNKRRRMGMVKRDLQFHTPSRRMLQWGCRTGSHQSLLQPDKPHLFRWWYIICFLSETGACFPWQVPARSRSSSFYPHPACAWGEARKTICTRKRCLKLEVSCCCLWHYNFCHATPQRGLCFRDSNKQWGGGNPRLSDLSLTQDRAYILCHAGRKSLWEPYAHRNPWKCFIILNIFNQCEVPDRWGPKIQSYRCFFKRQMQALLCSHLRSWWPQNANYICRKFEIKMSDFLLEFCCQKRKLKQ